MSTSWFAQACRSSGRARAFALLVAIPTCLMLAASAAFATPGSQLWANRYNGPANSDDTATALGVSPDGSTVFVTGYSPGTTTSWDYATVAYNAATGSKVWAKRYNGPASSTDRAIALGVSPDGSTVFVTGSSYAGAADAYDYATVAYNASTGSKVWAKRYNDPVNKGNEIARALGVSPDGSTVFVTGGTYGEFTQSSYDYATVAYNASTGAKVWSKRYNGPGNGDDLAAALRVSPDGSTVFVTGHSSGSTTSADYATVAYNTR
jgi:WD40 repeat protein